MIRFIGLLMLVAVPALGAAAQDEDITLVGGGEDVIVVCPVTGVIEPGVSVVIQRAIQEAEDLNAKAIIFRVDTPGGRVDSAVEIATAIQGAPCRTIAYIEGMGAISAGALISYACNDIIMTPGSNIGAATPVIPSAQGMLPTGEKEVSFMRAKMRALAESNGHNPDLAQAMVDKDIELRSYIDDAGTLQVYAITSEVDDSPGTLESPKSPLEDILKTLTGDTPLPVEQEIPEPEVASNEPAPGTLVFEDGSEQVLPSGKLLTMTPGEALKYGLISTTVRTLDEAVAFYELGEATYHEIEINWAEKTFSFLTNPTVTGLLLMLAMGGLYFEVKTPGFGIPGIIGAVSLLLLFGAHFVLGLTDVIDLVLIATGLVLLVVEMFVLPGFGIPGIAGFLCLIAGTYLALVDAPIPQYSWDYDRLGDVTYSLSVALITFGAFVLVTWRLLPRTAFYRGLMLSSTQQTSAGYVAQTEDEVRDAMGLRGVTTSMLRPTGWARFDDHKLQVVSHGEYMAKGVPVEIVEVEGNRYVVERREAQS